MLLMHFTIPLDPRTKKNHQTIAGTGPRCPICKKPKRQFVRQGRAGSAYAFAATPYLAPRPASALNTPVSVRYRFYMGTRRKVDALNLCAMADDLLVSAGILQDDCVKIVRHHDGTRVFYDKENPRTEIDIFTCEEGENGT